MPVTKSIINVLSTFYRSCQGFFGRPSFNISSIAKRTLGKIKYLLPFRNTSCDSSYSNPSIVPPISLLKLCSRPSAVTLTIISINIYSVYRSIYFSIISNVLYVCFVHIFFKFFKRAPFTLNASTPVVDKVTTTRIITPILNKSPYLVKSSFSHTVPKVRFLYEHSFFHRCFNKATATLFSMPSKFLSSCSSCVTAATTAQPLNMSTCTLSNLADYGKLSKLLSNNVTLVFWGITFFKSMFHKTTNAVRSSAQRLLLPARTSNNSYYRLPFNLVNYGRG